MSEEQTGSKAQDGEKVRFKGFGVAFEAAGRQLGGIIAVIASVSFAAWIVFKHDQDTVSMHSLLQEVVYVVSLKQEERDKLNLAMPTSLRNKVRDRRRDQEDDRR